MLLFVYNRSREISFYGNCWKKQTQASTFVTIFLRQWKKWLTVFLWNQYKPFKANNMKQFNETNLQITAFAATAAVVQKGNLVIPSSFAVIQLLRGNSAAKSQSNLRNFSAYIINHQITLFAPDLLDSLSHHRRRDPETPKLHNVLNKTKWDTPSKALEKSRKASFNWQPSSKDILQDLMAMRWISNFPHIPFCHLCVRE